MKAKFLFRPIPPYEVFSLNENGTTYSSMKMKEDFPGHSHNEYSAECLFSHGFFEAVEDDFPLSEIHKNLPRANGMDDDD